MSGESVIYKYSKSQRLNITRLHCKCRDLSSSIQVGSPRTSSLHTQWLSTATWADVLASLWKQRYIRGIRYKQTFQNSASQHHPPPLLMLEVVELYTTRKSATEFTPYSVTILLLHELTHRRRFGNNGISGEPVIYKYFKIQRLYITQLHYKCRKSSISIQLGSPRPSSLHIQWLSYCYLNWLIGVVSETMVHLANPQYTNILKFSVSTSLNSTINVWSCRILYIQEERDRVHSIFSDGRLLPGLTQWRRFGSNGISGDTVLYNYF